MFTVAANKRSNRVLEKIGLVARRSLIIRLLERVALCAGKCSIESHGVLGRPDHLINRNR